MTAEYQNNGYQDNTSLKCCFAIFLSGIEQSSHKRIQQFVSAVTGSRLGGYMEKLSETERIELGQRYLTDFVILSFKIKSEEEAKVRHHVIALCPVIVIKQSNIQWGLRPLLKMLLFQFNPKVS